ncbi:MAG: Hpt domain-containing protein [Candidatus Eremiobacterota bacterium]
MTYPTHPINPTHPSSDNRKEGLHIAHSVKGISANISANRLEKLACELEMKSEVKDREKWKEIFYLMKDRFAELQEEIKKFV